MGVGDDREDGDDHTHDGAGHHAVPEPQTDQRDDRENRNHLQHNGPRVDRPLHQRAATHQHADGDTDDGGEQEADETHLRGDPECVEHGVDVSLVEQRVGQHLVRRRKKESPLRREDHHADQVPEPDRRGQRHRGRCDHAHHRAHSRSRRRCCAATRCATWCVSRGRGGRRRCGDSGARRRIMSHCSRCDGHQAPRSVSEIAATYDVKAGSKRMSG